MLALLLLLLLPLSGAAGRTQWVVTDGNRTLYYCGTEQAPEKVLAALGIALRGCDRVSLSSEDGRRLLTVRRLCVVTVDCLGQRRYLPTRGATVGALLRSFGLPEGPVLSCEPTLPCFDGLQVLLRELRCCVRTSSSPLPPRTEYRFSAALEAGQTRELCPGSVGQLRETDALCLENGRELSRVTLTRESSEGACARLVLVGVDQSLPLRRLPTPESGDFTYRKKLRVEATAYSCGDRPGVTATGTAARVGAIAVDPELIPYGSRLYIVSDDGAYVYGYAVAEDCGAFRGNRIDLYFDTVEECVQFGRRMCTVYVLNQEAGVREPKRALKSS